MSAKPEIPSRAQFGHNHEVNLILQLQRTIGNQAVQRMLQAKAGQLETGVSIQQQEQTPAKCDEREPNSASVREIIENTYGGSRSNTYPVNELRDAWFHARNQREEPGGANCCNPELAAAEHYLYARYAVANGDYSPFEMKVLVWGYGFLKSVVPKTGICSKSPDTQGSRDWGYRGADDGANDLFHQELA